MKKIVQLTIFFTAALFLFFSCSTEEEKIVQKPAVVFAEEQTDVAIDILYEKDTTVNLSLRLMGPKQVQDVSVTISVFTDSTDAVLNTEYVLGEYQYTIPAGKNFVDIPVVIHSKNLTPYILKTLTLRIESAIGANSYMTIASLTFNKKIIFKVKEWVGDYTYYAEQSDGGTWDREAKLEAVKGEPYKMIMTGFWGSAERLECRIDDNTPKLLLYVAKETMLDPGWDADGKWLFEKDLIGEMDYITKKIVFTQWIILPKK